MADPWTLVLQSLPPWLTQERPDDRRAIEQTPPVDVRIKVGEEIIHAHLACLADAAPPAAALILLDSTTPDRLEALARYWRGLHALPIPPDPRVTPQRKERLRQMLRVVDAKLERQSYRAIAAALFPKHHIDTASWAGDALRETVIRLARDGMKLVHGGYRELLKRPRKP